MQKTSIVLVFLFFMLPTYTVGQDTILNYCENKNGRIFSSKMECTYRTVTKDDFLNAKKRTFCQKSNGEVYQASAKSKNKCEKGHKIIDKEEFKIAAKKKREKVKAKEEKKRKNSKRAKTLERIKNKKEAKKFTLFEKLSIDIGCGIKRNDIDECIARNLPSIIGSSPLTKKEIASLKEDKKTMGDIVRLISKINEAKSRTNYNQQPSEGPPNNQGNAVWKIDNAGRGYWDFGNGLGFMPPNSIYDNIINGFSINNNIKQNLIIGNGKNIVIN